MLVVILAYLVKKYVQIDKNGFFEKLKKNFEFFIFQKIYSRLLNGCFK